MARYGFRLFLTFDQMINVVFGPLLNKLTGLDHAFGYPDETLTSVFGKNRPTCKFCRFMCKLLEKIDRGHCDDGIEEDEGKNP